MAYVEEDATRAAYHHHLTGLMIAAGARGALRESTGAAHWA
jgi:hypothetical protein